MMEGFEQREGTYGGRPAVLTIPRRDKFTWAPEERHLRSVVHDARTGEVLSRGFPKFHNFGEVPEEDAETERAFAEGRVVLREKLDGSLIIRDVVDGRVCWRTRGALGLGEFEGRVMALVEAGPNDLRTGILRNPLQGAGESQLFEYTGPANRIVVRYPVESLTYLGAVSHRPRPEPGGYWGCVSQSHSVRTFSPAPMAEVAARVASGEMSAEGIVVTCWRGEAVKLVKMKSAEYIRMHSLMTECTRAKVFDLLERECGDGRGGIRETLERAGFDWEAMQDAREWANEYAARDLAVTKARNRIADALRGLVTADRKTVALEMKALTADMIPGAFALAMVMHTGGNWQDNAAAMRCDMPVNVYRATVKAPKVGAFEA